MTPPGLPDRRCPFCAGRSSPTLPHSHVDPRLGDLQPFRVYDHTPEARNSLFVRKPWNDTESLMTLASIS
jgi:hypothetical protein